MTFKYFAMVWLCSLSLGASVVTVVNQGESPSVSLTWAQIDSTKDTWVFRRTLPTGGDAGTGYELLGKVDLPGRSYTDTTVSPGHTYSYLFASTQSFYNGTASGLSSQTIMRNANYHAIANIGPGLIESRGTVLLVVEDTVGANGELAKELELVEMDLVGDGWTVKRLEFARHRVGDHRDLKAAIVAACTADPSINALYLFGRLPIAYTGGIQADGHGLRPHETDLYYADIDRNWTDTATLTVNGTVNNAPGDGKFDHTYLVSAIELMAGRVDLSNLYAFRKSEHEMLRDYIQKSHAWRHGDREVPYRALWNNSWLNRERQNLITLFGSSNLTLQPFQPTLNTAPHVWAVDFGNYDGYSANYLHSENKAVFTINFGSYKQQWANANNMMRNLLTQPDWGLTSAWGAFPSIDFYHMAAGLPIGYAMRDTYNRKYNGVVSGELSENHVYFLQTSLTNPQGELVHSLMGDPTLRLHPVPPPRSLAAAVDGETTTLTWTPPTDAARVGFHVYRSTGRLGPYERLTAEMLAADASSFTDPARPAGDVFYQVRAIASTATLSGAYLNPSQAVFAWVRADGTANAAPVAGPAPVIAAQSNVPTGIVFPGTDADGDTLVPVVVTNPANGVLRWNHGKAFYVSDLDYVGTDTFVYRLFDGVALSEPVVATVDVSRSRSDVLLAWQFGETKPSVSTYTRPGVVSASLANGSGLKRSADTSSTNKDAYYVTDAHTAELDPNGWIGWTVAPSSGGHRISIDKVVFSAFAGYTSTGQDYYPFRLRLRASVDNFATYEDIPLDQPELAVNNTIITNAMGNGRYFSAALPDRPEFRDTATPVQFRLYIWGTSAASVGTGLGKSGDRAYQSAADLVVFGRQTYIPDGTYTAWTNQIDWGNATPTAVADPDGDGLNNLMEYALGRDPAQPDGTEAVTLGRSEDGEQLTLTFDRIADPALTYVVEASSDLRNWSPVFASTGDENEAGAITVTDGGAVADEASRFLRLAVYVNDDQIVVEDIPRGTMTYSAAADSTISVGVPLLRPAVITTRVEEGDADSVTLVAETGQSPDFAALLDADEAYYLEITGHTYAATAPLIGQRFEVDVAVTRALADNRLKLADSARNTMELPASLAELRDYRVTVRPHWTLGGLMGQGADTGLNAGGLNAADQVHTWDNGFSVYYFRQSTLSPHWRNAATGTANHNQTVIAPGEGFFFKRQSGDWEKMIEGEVRVTSFAIGAIPAAGRLIGPGFPVDLSPSAMRFTMANGFTPALSLNDADQLLVWGDGGFQVYYLRNTSTPEWRSTFDTTNHNASPLLKAAESVLVRVKTPVESFVIPPDFLN